MPQPTTRIIIVDDHKMIRETWRFLLARIPGIEVIGECASGEEAIAAAGVATPDIMLMDINMVPVNGFEATAVITRAHPQIRVIGISVNDQPSYAKHMLEAGASAYVTKNSSLDEMHKAINAVLQGQTYICQEVRRKMPEP